MNNKGEKKLSFDHEIIADSVYHYDLNTIHSDNSKETTPKHIDNNIEEQKVNWDTEEKKNQDEFGLNDKSNINEANSPLNKPTDNNKELNVKPKSDHNDEFNAPSKDTFGLPKTAMTPLTDLPKSYTPQLNNLPPHPETITSLPGFLNAQPLKTNLSPPNKILRPADPYKQQLIYPPLPSHTGTIKKESVEYDNLITKAKKTTDDAIGELIFSNAMNAKRFIREALEDLNQLEY